MDTQTQEDRLIRIEAMLNILLTLEIGRIADEQKEPPEHVKMRVDRMVKDLIGDDGAQSQPA